MTLSLTSARHYLAAQARIRTPLGAGEYLDCLRFRTISTAFTNRIEIALESMRIYRELFSVQYRNSISPAFSIQREQELYLLIHAHCFPLVFENGLTVADLIRREPRFFLPFVPVRGLQRYDWHTGDGISDELEIGYQLALYLSTPEADRSDSMTIAGLSVSKDFPPAAPPLGSVGWSLFMNHCKVIGGPLRFLPMAFQLIGYKTGNLWLDLPARVGHTMRPWTLEEIGLLTLMRFEADQYITSQNALHNWFFADVRARLRLAIEVWNDAAEKETDLGYGGMMIDDLVDAGWLNLGNDMAMVPPDELERLLAAHEERIDINV